MRIERWLMWCGLVVAVSGCQVRSQQVVDSADATLQARNLAGGWTRSFEEETPESGIEIYRPTASRDFPATWFRMRYELHEDGTCEWLVLDPADAHFMAQGRWVPDPADDAVIRVYDSQGVPVEEASFRIVELTPDVLRITRASN